jgi:hypothetical protein
MSSLRGSSGPEKPSSEYTFVVGFELVRVIERLDGALEEHLAAACQQEAVARLGDAVAGLGPRVGALELHVPSYGPEPDP